ncbi:DUF4838 domain-containing protein [Dyadobacter helix]|nr:DUF4838 domain-containing protein [Dyadobacter sp. CECT 9275]
MGAMASPVEKKIAALLAARLTETGYAHVSLSTETALSQDTPSALLIYLGMAAHHNGIRNLMKIKRIPELTTLDPGQEGFLVKSVSEGTRAILLAIGKDDRGCLYAVGEILRKAVFKDNSLQIPDDLNVRSAPAFEIRGTQFGQSHIAKNLAKVRPWTDEETQRVILDYALAGANIFSTPPGKMFDFIKSFGLMTLGEFNPNEAPEVTDPAWAATESIGRPGYVCLSVPEAREHILKKCEKRFSKEPAYDFIQFKGGDGGGCECDLCKPYGLKFITLSEQLAGIIHKYHPGTRLYFTNQKFNNEDDNAIFAYLREKPRNWLWAWGYGPGSDATSWQPGHRQNHRMDLFQYPGFGPYGLYPLEIIRQMPPQHKLLYFNEITHWKYAQHAYIQMYPRADKNGDLPPPWSHEIYERRPDQALTMVYNRLTFYAWPRYYHRVFNDLMRYGAGDVTHSSGHHDHFNQWMWQRLLWSPRQTVEAVMHDYCTTWFGPAAAPEMGKAIFQLEENLEEKKEIPISKKEGINRYYTLVKSAGLKIPASQMKKDWLWRMYMQKGALDLYTKLNVRQQLSAQSKIEETIRKSAVAGLSVKKIDEMLSLINMDAESQEMVKLRLEATKLSDESNANFGERNDGIYNLKHDFIGLGWVRRQLERARLAKAEERKQLLNMIVSYEDPGEGGYYDNLGTANDAPHVESGYPYDHGQPYVAQMLSESNRPSQRSMHFTQDEDQGVTLRYTELDTTAAYKIRFTLVRPWYQERYAERMNQKSESIYANDVLIAENVELPLQMSDFFTFDIPSEAVKSGEVVIRFERNANVAHGSRISREQWRNSGGWGTMVSEAWLLKVKK